MVMGSMNVEQLTHCQEQHNNHDIILDPVPIDSIEIMVSSMVSSMFQKSKVKIWKRENPPEFCY
jgi:hypothetical protein